MKSRFLSQTFLEANCDDTFNKDDFISSDVIILAKEGMMSEIFAVFIDSFKS